VPYELLFQKKFAQSSSLVNAIHMFALSQNHKIVSYNPADGKATVVLSIEDLCCHNSKHKPIKTGLRNITFRKNL